MRDFTQGNVKRPAEAALLRVYIDHLSFPTLAPGAVPPPAGTAGTLTTKQVPQTPYLQGQVIQTDSTGAGAFNLTIASAVGPSKYQVTA